MGSADRPHLLIVGGDLVNQRIIKRMLSAQPWELTFASDGDTALEMFHQLKPHVVISDAAMPGMSGIELLARIHDTDPGTPTIFLTTHCDAEQLRSAINRARVFRALPKPADKEDLVGAIQSALRLAGERKAGADFGKYRLIRRLAVGGMAEVFLAELAGIANFRKQVVLKVMLPDQAAQADFREMFLDEGRLAASLTHPNVGQVFELGEQAGRYYLAMEYIEGESLSQLCKASTGPLPFELTVPVMMQLLDALSYVHARTDADGSPLRLVHRDVSPSNVIVTHQGHVKLVGFGVAKASTNQHHTRTGMLKGKFRYMSPEQTRCAALDHRSDLFSAGVILYELLTGSAAFTAENDLDVMLAVRSGKVARPSLIRSDLPPVLEQVVLRGLVPEVAGRFQSAREFQDSLGRAARELGISTGTRGVLATMARLSLAANPVPSQRDVPTQAGVMPAAGAVSAVTVPEPTEHDLSEQWTPLYAHPPEEQGPALARPRTRAIVTTAVAMVSLFTVVAGWFVAGRRPEAVVASPEVVAPAADLPLQELPLVTETVLTSAPRLGARPAVVARSLPERRPSTDEVTPASDARIAELTGRLRITAPPGTHVWLQGQHLGPTPLSIELPAGSRRLFVGAPEAEARQAVDVTVEAGIEHLVEISARP